MSTKNKGISIVIAIVLAIILFASACGGGTPQPTVLGTKIPHSVGAGFENCIGCHTTGEQAMPADHAGRTNSVCQDCHKPA